MTRIHIISTVAVVAVALASVPVIAKNVSQAEVQKLGQRIAKMEQQRSESELLQYGQTDGSDKLMWIEHLPLSAYQREEIERQESAFKKATFALQDELRSLEAQLRAKWASPEPDRRAILSLQRHIHQRLAAIAEKRTEHHLDVLSVLTSAQREQLQTLQKDQCRSVN